MCRTGGRRCPCSRGQLDKHNARRRRNRAIKKAVLDHLRHESTERRDQELIDRLEVAPPIEAKRWARANNFPLSKAEEQSAAEQGRVPATAQASLGAGGARRHAGAGRGDVPVEGAPDEIVGPPPELLDQMVALLRQLGLQVPPAKPDRPSSQHVAAVSSHVDAAVSSQGQIPVERLLLDSRPISSKRVGHGINRARRVDLGNGVYAYHKSFGATASTARAFGQKTDLQPLCEVAAWRLAERLGPPWSTMVAPCVLREVDGKLGSLSLERPGSVGSRPDQHSEDAMAAGFFDCLIGQQDRHAGNYLVDQRGITLIDHGFAFSKPGDRLNAAYLMVYRMQASPALRPNERDALTRLLASPDMLGLRGLLPADRLEAMLQRARDMLSKDRLD